MHRLYRDRVPKPACLDGTTHKYSALDRNQKEEIRSALLKIQECRCAYCERRTADGPNDGHIEHFRKQAAHHELECEWENLFWSCNDITTCGRYKDTCDRASGSHRKFSPDDIINPAEEDPEDLLLFVADGTVRARGGLDDLARHRVEETLRVFQLNAPLLRRSREDAVKYVMNGARMIAARYPDAFEQFVCDQLAEAESLPFSSAVKCFLKGLSRYE